MNRLPTLVAVPAVLLLGLSVSIVATSASTHADWTSQALAHATPPQFADYESVRAELQRHGFACGERVNLGTPQLFVSSTNFKRAKDVACDYIRGRSLTLRIALNATSDVWEVWEEGTKQREETYLISPSNSR